MKNLSILVILLIMSIAIQAQDALPTFQETSDPRAAAVLSKVRTTYESFKTLEADFSLLIEMPEMEAERQKGNMKLKGEQYRLTVGGREIISDGKSLWYYLPKSNEVQINTIDEEAASEEILSPNALLKIYERDDYIYQLVFEGTEQGKSVQKIEFKPIDRESEYAKLRATFDKKNHYLLNIIAFAKDGSRYTLNLDKITPNPDLPASTFTFNNADHPGVYVEDLRID